MKKYANARRSATATRTAGAAGRRATPAAAPTSPPPSAVRPMRDEGDEPIPYRLSERTAGIRDELARLDGHIAALEDVASERAKPLADIRTGAMRAASVVEETAEKVRRLYTEIGHLAAMVKAGDVLSDEIISLLVLARHIECDVDEIATYLPTAVAS